MVIVQNFQRPPAELVRSLEQYAAATVHEALGKQNAMEPELGPVGPDTTVCGPACTVRVPVGDNAMAHLGTDIAAPGDVLVVSAQSHRAAIWGELATRNARQQDLGGLVTDGNVRDSAFLADSEFPVFAPAVSQAGAVKETPGAVNVPVSVGGITVEPGDVVVGDADGVTVVPRDKLRETVEAAERIHEHEAHLRQQIADGETLADLLDLYTLLEERDVPTVETPADR